MCTKHSWCCSRWRRFLASGTPRACSWLCEAMSWLQVCLRNSLTVVINTTCGLSAKCVSARVFTCPPAPANAVAYSHPEYAIYFYAFVFIGSFFAINLFVGVIIDKFSRLRAEYDGSALQTEEQQQWTNMQRILQAIQPHVYLEEPEHPVRRVAFRIARHKWFNHFITTCIVVNTVIMCMNHDRESSLYVLVQAIRKCRCVLPWPACAPCPVRWVCPVCARV